MFDRQATALIKPAVTWLAQRLAAAGVQANALTFAGFGTGIAAALLVSAQWYALAMPLLLLSRLLDALDGAVARQTAPTDRGGFLDITLDFLFYAAVPLAFALADPAANAAAAAALLAAFYVNGTSFLGFAILAEKRGMTTTAQGLKSLYFSNGLLEGTETILFFVALCLLPALFAPLAWGFAALCLVTAGLRVAAARRIFSTPEDPA